MHFRICQNYLFVIVMHVTFDVEYHHSFFINALLDAQPIERVLCLSASSMTTFFILNIFSS